MEQNIITIVSLIIIGIGILGTFLPVLPGLAVSFVGLILYKWRKSRFFYLVYCHFWDFNAHFIGAQLHYSHQNH